MEIEKSEQEKIAEEVRKVIEENRKFLERFMDEGFADEDEAEDDGEVFEEL
ncbi:MAG: hypothetical protein HYS23_13765 [Geobacter sp.]|nr:hypothetical protein [Geobacter sp.]